jgi:hypothetical protein
LRNADVNILSVKSGLKNNRKGFSMIQALVAAAITSIVSLGVVSMIESSRKMQRRTTLMSTLNDLRARIETNLRDQTAFNNTITQNATSPFLELRTGANVTATPLTAPVKFVMYEPGGVAWDMLGTVASDSGTYAGFSEKGTPCTGFSPTLGSGSDSCPISYRFLVSAACLTGASCKDPQLTVTARLVFNPSTASTSILNTWRGIIQQVSGSSQVDAPDKFDVQIKRTATSITKYFLITASVDPTGSTSPGDCSLAATTFTGGGRCTSATTTVHPLTLTNAAVSATGWVRDSDANSMVSVSGTNGSFKVATTGYYKCTVQAKSFSSNVTFSLYDSTSSTYIPGGTGTAIAGQYSEGQAKFDVAFNATAGHDYMLHQKCSDTTLQSCTLGFAKANYTNLDGSFRLVSIWCDRVDVSY